MVPSDTNILTIKSMLAVSKNKPGSSVAGALHPTPEDVGGTYTNKNLHTQYRAPAVMAARQN